MKKKIKYIVEEHFKTNGMDEIENRKKVFEDIVIGIIKKEEAKGVL